MCTRSWRVRRFSPTSRPTAPIAQAQLAETFVVNQIHLQTTLASKAARVVTAARDRALVDFGARRIHGTDAAIKAARAFYIAGVAATSNVLAGNIYGLPVTGTMAHSFVQAWDDEKDAFRSFVRLYPDTVLLVDTYDTPRGVGRVCLVPADPPYPVFVSDRLKAYQHEVSKAAG